MTYSQSLPTQITNRNFLSPTAFRFNVERAPKIAFYGNRINIPGLTFENATQTNYLTDIPLVGTKLGFNDLSVRFYIDEGLENYVEIQNWLRGIGYPESLREIYIWRKGDGSRGDIPKSEMNLYSDGTLTILDNQNNPKFKVKFQDLFPVSLQNIEFDATVSDLQFLQAEVQFKYSIYTIEDIDCSKC